MCRQSKNKWNLFENKGSNHLEVPTETNIVLAFAIFFSSSWEKKWNRRQNIQNDSELIISKDE